MKRTSFLILLGACSILRSLNADIVVHLDCGDGRQTLKLAGGNQHLIHAIDTDSEMVTATRKILLEKDLYGRVTVDRYDGKSLPYADNLINRIVAESTAVPETEILRVLVPGGEAEIDGKITRKPWPSGMDDWTHYRYSANGNAVSRDQLVRSPDSLQWIAGPLRMKHHNLTPNFSALVSANGRIFYILEDGLPGVANAPEKWFLHARDGFNGSLLWKVPLKDWGYSAWVSPGTQSGSRFDQPLDIPRLLVAAENFVYAPLGALEPVSKIHAQTGKIVTTYPGTERVSEILLKDWLLIVSTHTGSPDSGAGFEKKIMVFDAESGAKKWTTKTAGIRSKSGDLAKYTTAFVMAVDDALCFMDGEDVMCVDLADGTERWRFRRPPQIDFAASYFKTYIGNLPTLIGQDDVLIFSQIVMKDTYKRSLPWYEALETQLLAISMKTGEKLWSYTGGAWDYAETPSIFLIDGLVWTFSKEGFDLVGLDLETGSEVKRHPAEKALKTEHHHRCYSNKATERFLLAGRRGVEFIDFRSGKNLLNHWIRGACRYGIMPANGLLYVPPDPCMCYATAKVNGFLALRGQSSPPHRSVSEPRLKKGPAFGGNAAFETEKQEASNWPTFRGNSERLGFSKSTLPRNLAPAWTVRLKGTPTPPVIADGRMHIAGKVTDTLFAFDTKDGSELWQCTLSGRLDTPPTIHGDTLLTGTANGYVYALRAGDGELAWRFRAAPREERIVAYGKLESPWPIHGGVLVQNGAAFACAGRSSFLDGGVEVFSLDPATGSLQQTRRINSVDPDTGEGEYHPGLRYDMAPDKPGALSDVLVSHKSGIYLRHIRMDPKNLSRDFESEVSGVRLSEMLKKQTGVVLTGGPQVFSDGGLLDDGWFNQSFWSYAGGSHCRLLVCDEQFTYGVSAYGGKRPSRHSRSKYTIGGKGYTLFAEDRMQEKKKPWTLKIPIRVTTMAVTDNLLVVAGAPDVTRPEEFRDAIEGRKGGLLWMVDKKTGEKVMELPLDSVPVWNGVAVADGQLFLSFVDGSTSCFR